MLIIAGGLRIADGGRDAYLATCRAIVEAARVAPGCLDFALSADPVDHDRINVYERWASEAALLAFRAAGPAQEQAAEIVDADVQRYVIGAVEPP